MLGPNGVQPRRDGTVLSGVAGLSAGGGRDPMLLLGSGNMPNNGDRTRTRWDLFRQTDLLQNTEKSDAQVGPKGLGETNEMLGELRELREEGSGQGNQNGLPTSVGAERYVARAPRYGLSGSWGGRWKSAPRETTKTWQDSPFERRASYTGPYWGRRWPYYGPNRFRGYYPRPEDQRGGSDYSAEANSTNGGLVVRGVRDLQECFSAMDSSIKEVLSSLRELNRRVEILAGLHDTGGSGFQRDEKQRVETGIIPTDSGLGSSDSGDEELFDSGSEPSDNHHSAATALGLLGRGGERTKPREGHLASDETNQHRRKVLKPGSDSSSGDDSDLEPPTQKLYSSPASLPRGVGRAKGSSGSLRETAGGGGAKRVGRSSTGGRVAVERRLIRAYRRGAGRYFVDQCDEGSSDFSGEKDDDRIQTDSESGNGEPLDDSGGIAEIDG